MAKETMDKEKMAPVKKASGSTGMVSKFTVFDLLMYVLITLLALICLYPFLNVVAITFSGYNAVLSNKVTWFPIDFSTSAIRNILSRKQIWQAMWTTVEVTILGTGLSLVLTIAASYALSRDYLPGRTAITSLIMFTMYFGGGIIPTFLVVKSLGLYNSLGALIIPNSISVFNFIVMRTFFRELPMELEEAAKIDGATEMQILFKIILPLSVPIIATIGLFYAVTYWNDYFQALLYISDEAKYTLQLCLRALLFGTDLDPNASVSGDIGEVMTQSLKMASVVVATVPILVVYPWLQKYFVKGVMIGSVKG